MLDLVIAETPLETIRIVEAAHWHPRHADDAAVVVWLRQLGHPAVAAQQLGRPRPDRARFAVLAS